MRCIQSVCVVLSTSQPGTSSSTGNQGISQGKPVPCQQGVCPAPFTCVDDVCVQDITPSMLRSRKTARGRGNEELVLAPGAEISKNLGRFAERRTDILGDGVAGAEQTVFGKLGEEAPQPTKLVQSRFSLDFGPCLSNLFGMDLKRLVPHTFAVQSQVTIDELEPEAEWLKKVNGAIDLRIQLPVSAEFNMDGSIIGLQIDVSSQVSDLKQQLQDKLSMPIGKQKLIFDSFFPKDNSLWPSTT
ncbi:unnamed protein product [Cylicocyclus nassatus]|uniref:Ubiquitin-like domain-containing protein n=1 Tax=Cylicocyclus nassatus TaxID=53992 RepID=A0AA36M3F6_CYLNA|nr:unnamed protein product [Cylicocyclus nassatus]